MASYIRLRGKMGRQLNFGTFLFDLYESSYVQPSAFLLSRTRLGWLPSWPCIACSFSPWDGNRKNGIPASRGVGELVRRVLPLIRNLEADDGRRNSWMSSLGNSWGTESLIALRAGYICNIFVPDAQSGSEGSHKCLWHTCAVIFNVVTHARHLIFASEMSLLYSWL